VLAEFGVGSPIGLSCQITLNSLITIGTFKIAYLGADASISVDTANGFSSLSSTGESTGLVSCAVSTFTFVISPRFARFASLPDSSVTGDLERSRLTEVEAVEGVMTDAAAFGTSTTVSLGEDGEDI
jgi:hypothetical protein